jgi:hypothetical protein
MFDALSHFAIGHDQNIEHGEFVPFALEFINRYAAYLDVFTHAARPVHGDVAAHMDPWIEDKAIRKNAVSPL